MNNLRMRHFLALLLIGDGVVALIQPEHDAAAWSQGPWLWRQAMNHLKRNPTTTRLVATTQIVAGIYWLISEERKRAPESLE
jgi:hypothetical protein